MSVLYLTKDGTKVSRSNGRLQITFEEKLLQSVIETYVEHIVVMGNVQLTHAVIMSVLKNGGSISWMDRSGAVRGVLGQTPAHSETVIAQSAALLNNEKRLEIARFILSSKLKEQKKLLNNYNKYLKSEELNKGAAMIGRMLKITAGQQNQEKLMGIEGLAAKAYYSCFNEIIKGTGFEWTGRNRRPPKDPMNVMLSFAYCLTEREVRLALMEEGLHPGIGYLHSAASCRDSLVYDVLEPFRSMAAERFVFSCINRKIIKPEHFACEQGKCRLTDEGKRIFTGAFEDFIAGKNFDALPLRQRIRSSLQELEEFFM